MKNLYLLIIILVSCCKPIANKQPISENEKEFNHFISKLESEFIYKTDKSDIIDCIKANYHEDIDTITKTYYKVLYYESILNEFYDSHISLNTNTDQSYRLRSPVYVINKEDKFYIQNVFASQLENKVNENIINAEILKLNGVSFNKAINDFPSKCLNKSNRTIAEWIANKIISGKRNEPRILTIKLTTGRTISIDIDTLKLTSEDENLKLEIIDDIAYVRINNSLGNSELVKDFDETIPKIKDTKALILDLRNTPNGGNTDVAEPIMGLFISETKGYQICENSEKRYTKEVIPRNSHYSKPLFVLVGRWTGSMGEGMAIGFDGMERATIIGTEMNRLAGGINTIKLLKSNFSYHIPVEKMYHLNGKLRETYIPNEYVNQINLKEDYYMNYALKMIKSR